MNLKLCILITIMITLPVLSCAKHQSPPTPAPATQPLSIEDRIHQRSFPSIFQAWSPADNLPHEDPLTTLARHDLVFHGPEYFHLQWDKPHIGLATAFTPASLPAARAMRQTLLAKNPHLIILAEIRYRDAPRNFLPAGHPWWLYDKAGKPVMGWEEGGFIKLDFASPAYQQQVAAQAHAALASGVFDGIMLDWWLDDQPHLQLIRTIRSQLGQDALILANANDRTTPLTAPYINGFYMECWRSQSPQDWQRIAASLQWAQNNLREPRINCLETWFHNSRNDLNLMRATTTLSLTLSDGYCLFCDPDPLPTPDHLHDWYPFWNKSLGQPLSPPTHPADGSYRREFHAGTALYNPMGNPTVTIHFDEDRTSLATGTRARQHQVPPADGDLFLR